MPASGVIPVLGYPDVSQAAQWLCAAFGFRERLVIGDHRIQLHGLEAKAHGATILQEPTDFPYGERQYSARDFAGYVWTFSQSIADVDPETWGGVLKNS